MSKAKEIVEEVPGCIKVFSDGSVERVAAGEGDVHSPIAPVPASQAFVDGVATRDLQIDPETGAWVRIYFPQIVTYGAVVRRPVVVHFHGGGFCIGSPDWRMYYNFYARLAKQCGVVCVSLKYRLAPEHRLPIACDDAWGCLQWIRSVALGELEDPWLTDYADFGRCYLIGDSAGGTLVHSIAARAGTENLHPLCLRGGVLISPGFLKEQRSRSEIETPYDPLLTLEMVDKFLKLALPEGATKDHPIVNPMATDLQRLKLPPLLVAIAGGDMIRDTQFEYCEAMKKAAQCVEILKYEEVGHCFHLNPPLLQTDPNASIHCANLLDAVQEFFDTHNSTSEAV